jgi:hypothetical protein
VLLYNLYEPLLDGRRKRAVKFCSVGVIWAGFCFGLLKIDYKLTLYVDFAHFYVHMISPMSIGDGGLFCFVLKMILAS